MEIKFDKLLLAVVPYLYFVSICYYWGYWGTLDIDAFSYYAISDIIKSIVSPISSTLGGFLLLVLALASTNALDEMSKSWSNKKIVIISLLSTLVIYYAFYYGTTELMINHPDVKTKGGYFVRIGIYIIYLFLTVRLTLKICFWIITPQIKEYYNWIYFSIYCLIAIPGKTYMSGKDNALRIIQNKEFEYVSTYSLTAKKPWIYKYLGKAGEYYLLSTLDNKRFIIAPTSKLSPLITSRFLVTDSISTREFRLRVNLLTAAAQ